MTMLSWELEQFLPLAIAMKWDDILSEETTLLFDYYISGLHCIEMMIAVEENWMFSAVTNGESENKTKKS